MKQEEKVFSKDVRLLKKLQRKSFHKENNKISKWVKQLQQDSFFEMKEENVLQKNRKDLNEETQEILNQVARNIFQDLIKK